MTVLEVIQSATGYLAKHGVGSPRLSAEHLLAKVLGMKRLELYLCFDRPVSEAERVPLREDVRRRAEGVPLQHLLGEWDFYGRTFRCDPRALIPRQETELLAEWVLESLPDKETELAVLDVGTGTGVLAITLALERPAWKISGGDLSVDALNLAKENAQRLLQDLPPERAVQWIQTDLIPHGSQWDVIVSNPPYIPTDEIPRLAREVRHDPLLALDGGKDGLDIIRRLAVAARQRLRPGGWLFLEIGAGQRAAVEEILRSAGFGEICVRQDHAGIPRCVRARCAE